jgi:hypothetical protein
VLSYSLNEFILFANPKKITWQRKKQQKRKALKNLLSARQRRQQKKAQRKALKKEPKKEQDGPLRKALKNVNKNNKKRTGKQPVLLIYREWLYLFDALI